MEQTNADTSKETRSPETDLALIRAMMQAGRKRIGVDGILLVVWGVMLTLGFTAQYIVIMSQYPHMILEIWIPVYVVGFLLSYLVEKRNPRTPTENNLALKVYAMTWKASGISIAVYFFLSLLSDTFDPMIITILTTVCFGSSFFVISVITGLQKLKFVAAGWWLLTALFSIFNTIGPETLLILSAASIFLLLIPGYFLRRMLSVEA